MYDIIYSIVFFSVLFIGFIWLMCEIVRNYMLCKEKRSQAQSEDSKE